MASSKLSTDNRYTVSNPFRGLMIIVNNINFADLDKKRNGSERDAERLEATFGLLGFECRVHNDQSCVQMLQEMSKVAKLDLDAYDCLAVAILTHGEDGNIICGVGKDDICSLDKILKPLKEIKRGIPKLVFVQACRGVDLDKGRSIQSDGGSGTADNRDDQNYIRVPIESDFLYHFSTSPGYYSFRNSRDGSIFIQSLCNVFDEYIKENVEFDLLTSLVQVNRRVAEGYASTVETKPAYHNKKQMPSFMCMLRKSFFLKKKQT